MQTFFKSDKYQYFVVQLQGRGNEQMPIDHLIESLLKEGNERDVEKQRTLNKVSDKE